MSYNPFGPPGHQPGVHVPGTTVPIAYAVEMAAQRAAMAANSRPETDAERAAREQQWQKQRSDEINRLKSIGDPIERAVTAMFRYGRLLGDPNAMGPIDVAIMSDLAHETVRDTWRSYNYDLHSYPPWNGRAVASWFARWAYGAGFTPNTKVEVTMEVRGVFGKYKNRVKESGMAWRFEQGSNIGMGDRKRLTVFIFADGHYVHCQELNMSFSDESAGNLSAYALYQMGEMRERVGS